MQSGKTQENVQQINFQQHHHKVDCETHKAVDGPEQVGKDPFYFGRMNVPFIRQSIVFFVGHIVIDGDKIFLHSDRHRNHNEFGGQNSWFLSFSSVLFFRQVDENNAVTKVLDENKIHRGPEFQRTNRTGQHKGINVFRKVDSFSICKRRGFQIDVDNVSLGIFFDCVVEQFRLKPLRCLSFGHCHSHAPPGLFYFFGRVVASAVAFVKFKVENSG
mmetsp:Transcript_16130/g.40441  ORF Transcript_16130/g.40441 Transcript_16130/m.40441 type:complete len:216 (-) Transcript_16130:1098-1745(-)